MGALDKLKARQAENRPKVSSKPKPESGPKPEAKPTPEARPEQKPAAKKPAAKAKTIDLCQLLESKLNDIVADVVCGALDEMSTAEERYEFLSTSVVKNFRTDEEMHTVADQYKPGPPKPSVIAKKVVPEKKSKPESKPKPEKKAAVKKPSGKKPAKKTDAKAGGCPSQSEATSRLVSQALRSGIAVEELVEQLRGLRCHATMRKSGDVKVLSCPDAIGRVLEAVANMHKDETVPPVSSDDAGPAQAEMCPECGEPMEHEGGCSICKSCGHSKCG